ncbi:MAG: oligosaccharide flippase family protein [Bacteroidales bacterium]|jgi:O-antigen/teichoic acid export membrane protein|nr:oligosaccharide flippase family protein [Bacteroidales bacterium]
MSEIKKLASQTTIYGIPTILGRFLNYFLVPLQTYNMPVSDYGVVNTFYAYASFMMILLTYGMETAFFRYSQEEKAKKVVYNTAMLSLFSTTFIFFLITFIFINPLTNLMNGNLASNVFSNKYVLMFLLILSFDALRAIPYAKLRVEQKAKRFAIIKSVDIFTNIGCNLLFFLVIKPKDLISAIFLSNLIASVVSFVLLTPQYLQFRLNFSLSLLKKMLKYGLPVMIGGLAGMINETFDRIALQHLIAIPKGCIDSSKYIMNQIGIYSGCYKFAILMTLFIQAFKFAAEPFFFSKMKNADAKQTYSKVMSVYTVFLCIVFLAVMAYIDVLKYFVEEKYRVGLMIVPVLLIANLCLGVYYNLSIWYKVIDKTIYGAYITIAGAVITLVLNYFSVPIFGYMGAAWTTLICYFAIMVICYFCGQKFYPINYPIKQLSFYFLLAIILYFVMKLLPIEHLLLRLAANTVILAGYIFLTLKSKLLRS